MTLSDGKDWASKYLLDPLNEPEPSIETGPGSHFGSTVMSAENETKSKRASTIVSQATDNTTSSQTTSPRHSRQYEKFRQSDNPFRTSSEIPTSSSKSVVSTLPPESTGRRRRSSLHERFPGDETSRPLDMIRKVSLRAHRSPHLRKDHHHGIDSIDKLAGIEDAYHHAGPFDVVSQARNISSRDSPVAALRSSNTEALRATPREAIVDSLRHHRPIDNVAALPPGIPDRNGRVLHYVEGHNMQRGTGDDILGQWPGAYDYHPEDLKGKGEPSFTIDRSLKNHEKHKRAVSDGYEMKSNPRSGFGNNNPFSPMAQASSSAEVASGHDQNYREWETNLRRSKSAKGSMPSKISNLRRRLHVDSN